MGLQEKVKSVFQYKVVKKNIVNNLKNSIKLPVYVLEYLISQYSDQELTNEEIVNKVKEILNKHYILPEDKNKIKDSIKTNNSIVIIDKLLIDVDLKRDMYIGTLNTAGLKDILVDDEWIRKYRGLLEGGMWGLIRLEKNEDSSKFPVMVGKFSPMQISTDELEEYISKRKEFTRDEWLDFLINSIGLNPDKFDIRQKLLMLLRLVPHCESNYNMIELGPRETGKSYTYNELSPYSLLVAGGKATVPVLFYNLTKQEIGLVGIWDVVAFDEVANVKFDDSQGPAMLQTYMESGNFARDKMRIEGKASMVFVGNIDNPLQIWEQGGNLFETLADELQTPAIIDRFHYYLPGWEMPKMKTEYYSTDFGFISDYFSKILHDFRKRSYSEVIDKYFTLDKSLSSRDTKAIRKTVSGLLKLLHPDLEVTADELKEYLELAMEGRMRVKEQLKRRGGLEFFGSAFKYLSKEDQITKQVFLKEMTSGIGNMVSQLDIGEIYTVITKDDRMFSLKIETNSIKGNGSYQITGRPSLETKETMKNIYNYIKSNSNNMGVTNKLQERIYITQLIDENSSGGNQEIGAAFYLSMISIFINRPIKSKTVIIGSMTVNGNLIKTSNLYEKLEFIIEQGAKMVYVPISNQPDTITMPSDIWSKLSILFYCSAEDLSKKVFELE
ncbi:protease Lon-related BREX system protein BrxL [Clostridium estertheticum]|uniref:protease Lon-related BREX system protein BrxL n=1 Tax=Clostridium estertheticum TaxID=238834 RepID=UPI001C6EB45C|nr:protease Lon-related BREX system protein BrxL [Clostridium estertheticum]MBW9152351.1 protease Lon-related BREX system protein BrxL [Clostridium estertheticum]WLC82794.1 protease Lon-related BREX system protein BrxL [Clostridium estertheticum]